MCTLKPSLYSQGCNISLRILYKSLYYFMKYIYLRIKKLNLILNFKCEDDEKKYNLKVTHMPLTWIFKLVKTNTPARTSH